MCNCGRQTAATAEEAKGTCLGKATILFSLSFLLSLPPPLFPIYINTRFMLVRIGVRVYVYIHMCAFMYGSQRSDLGVVLQEESSTRFETGSH